VSRRWRKLGRIFDPGEHTLPADCFGYAQSPQALVLEDRVRIFFSTRARDPGNGKFFSHVAFVDMRRDLRGVIGVSRHPVIAPGGRGCFDEHGIFPMHVLRHEGKIFGYTSGWSRRVSVSVETAIGLAFSHDEGRSFQRIGDGPVLAASLQEPCLVGDPFVLPVAGVLHMWYIFGTGWRRFEALGPAERIYRIAHAISRDGVHWRRNDGVQVIESRLGPQECQALPTVARFDGQYHMYFCYRNAVDFRANPEHAYRLGHAVSDDLEHWARIDGDDGLERGPDAWDSEMMCYPHVFQCDGRILLLYNGNEFGRHGFGLAELA
jgi:hypothetical protein